MKQSIITPAAGKRIIAKALTAHPYVREVLVEGLLVIIAGTTNGYVAEEILKSLGQEEGFTRQGFWRGVVTPTAFDPPEYPPTRDVVIQDGTWQQGKTIFDVTDQLGEGDLVMKGANAFDTHGQAGVHIGSTTGGTVMAAVSAVIGRRSRLLIPVGLEKRISEDINLVARRVNAPGSEGPRLMPMPGEIFTEIDAIRLHTGAEVFLVSAGGVYGAEGAVRLGIEGSTDQVSAAEALITECLDENTP